MRAASAAEQEVEQDVRLAFFQPAGTGAWVATYRGLSVIFCFAQRYQCVRGGGVIPPMACRGHARHSRQRGRSAHRRWRTVLDV